MHKLDQRRRSGSAGLLRIGCAAALLLFFGWSACNREQNGGVDLGAGDDLSGAADLGDQDLTGGPDLACTPEVQSCTGLCGPVRDDCTGQTFQCGACAAGTVCDLDAHICVTPKADCVALGKVCGTTKNSCGQTISCTPFTCTDPTQECDPDTNQCVMCEAASCADLGYECGTAWLGCGPQSNTTDCGACPSDKNCNDALHVCEPKTGGTCGGMTPKQMCDAAAANSGVQCGVITNGCGGLIDCTSVDPAYVCRAGTFCGGAGVPNQCAPAEPPTECFVAGYNCGTLMSACGGTVNCGTCDASKMEVCNLAAGSTAGTCGPACSLPQKTCAADYAGKCGKQLDNNCWPKLDCNCASGVCSTSVSGMTGTCGAVKMCSDYTSGAANQPCSTAPATTFPKGDGTNLTCPCAGAGNGPGQAVCQNIDGTTHQGTCCVRATCGPTDTIISDGCGGMINCCTINGKSYNPTTMMCCTPGDPCGTTYAGKYATGVVDGCGQPVNGNGVCDCSRYGSTPVDPDTDGNGVLDNGGSCCAAPNCSNGVGGTYCDGRMVAASCNPNVKVTCSGNCGAGVCNGGTCCTPAACPNDGKYHASFNPGCGLAAKVCDCSRFGSTPVDPDLDNNGVIDDGGSCCANPTCPSNACAASTPAAACNAAVTKSCGINCTGSNKCCNGASCVTNSNCASQHPGKCGTGLSNGCGANTLNCPCTAPATCSTATPGVEGTCNCPPVTCNGCNPAMQTNACGNSASCGCTGGQVCGAANSCCTQKTCADLPAGWQCGSITDTCTNTTFGCPCSTTGKPLNACNASDHMCECTPIKCCKDTGGVEPCIQPGAYSPSLGYPDHNDGCGGSGTCSS
jgi:hypothetical protein